MLSRGVPSAIYLVRKEDSKDPEDKAMLHLTEPQVLHLWPNHSGLDQSVSYEELLVATAWFTVMVTTVRETTLEKQTINFACTMQFCLPLDMKSLEIIKADWQPGNISIHFHVSIKL